MNTTARRELFCVGVAQGLSFAKAARRAGSSFRSASAQGWALAQKPEVQARIQELREQTPAAAKTDAIVVDGFPQTSRIQRIVDSAGRTVGLFIPALPEPSV